MDHGLSENFTDRVSPIKPHIDHLEALGVQSGPLNPHVNSVTSDVVKVCHVDITVELLRCHTMMSDVFMHKSYLCELYESSAGCIYSTCIYYAYFCITPYIAMRDPDDMFNAFFEWYTCTF